VKILTYWSYDGDLDVWLSQRECYRLSARITTPPKMTRVLVSQNEEEVKEYLDLLFTNRTITESSIVYTRKPR
jgi:hypothetical protein